jgi:hypothetical protein
VKEELIKKVLRECYCLEDNPFDPSRDPQNTFDFRANKASLVKPLDIFNISALEPFFIKIGKFQEAVDEVEEFLIENNWTPGVDQPPTFLVKAENGMGRTTLANYIAYLVKDQRVAGVASLYTQDVPDENFAQFAFSLKKVIEVHAKESRITGCDSVFSTFPDALLDPPGGGGPRLNLLNNVFQMLVKPLSNAPPLLLVVESITYEREDWMYRLYKMLSPLNVVFIFLTTDERVRMSYNELVEAGSMAGRSVELEALDQALTLKFFNVRFGLYRAAGPCAGQWYLFPFGQDIFDQAFKPEKDDEESPTFGIKFLLAVFRGALNLKINRLSKAFAQPNPQLPPDELAIIWNDVEDAFKRVVRKTARAKD